MTVVVVDTSVTVSALVFGGVPRLVLAELTKPPFQLAVSTELEAELAEILGKKFGWTLERIEGAQQRLWGDALRCVPVALKASRDPKDDHVLGCAVAGGAQLVVSGDKDLLSLNPYRGIAILTPAQFLATRLRQREDSSD